MGFFSSIWSKIKSLFSKPSAEVKPPAPDNTITVPAGQTTGDLPVFTLPPVVVQPPGALISLALPYVLQNEGVWSNDSFDPGGATKYGIIHVEWNEYYGRTLTIDEVKNAPLTAAQDIYQNKYWDKMRLGQIKHQGVATAIFDQGVNRGIGVGVRYAQAVAGISQDGIMYLKSLDAINAMDPKIFITAYAEKARNGYLVLLLNPFKWKFRGGWLARANRLLTLIDSK